MTKIFLQDFGYIYVKETEGEIIDKMANWAISLLTETQYNNTEIQQPIKIMRDKVIFFQQLTK